MTDALNSQRLRTGIQTEHYLVQEVLEVGRLFPVHRESVKFDIRKLVLNLGILHCGKSLSSNTFTLETEAVT